VLTVVVPAALPTTTVLALPRERLQITRVNLPVVFAF
jgi:hypothetical protein